MSTLFPPITERRYATHKRPFLNEYHLDGRKKAPDGKGSCGTLSSAKSHALRAIGLDYVHTVRVFNRVTGQYELTYRKSASGILIGEGFIK